MAIDERRATMRDEGMTHPEAEILAAYAERTLDAEERLAVDRHAAECPDCREVLADTCAFVDVAPAQPVRAPWQPAPAPPLPFRRRRWAIGVVTGLAAAAVLVLAVRGALPERFASWIGLDSRPDLDEFVAAFVDEPNRLVEGRLSGGFPYGAAPPITRGATSVTVSPGVRIALARIEAAAETDKSLKMQWALGVARLGVGSVDEAITILAAAARSDADNAPLHSDLSAAYLARARREAREEDARNALAAADNALALSPGMPEALFNRALALETLRPDQASQAWRSAAEREPNSPWAREALTRAESGR